MAAPDTTGTPKAAAQEDMDSPTQSSKPLLVPLTTKQERRVMDHLDERLLNLMRGYKKRSEESSTTPTLEAYLAQARYILSFTLQIPPIRPSAALRTAYLLRLTNDVLTCIPGYPATLNSLPDLLSWLDELDRAWQVVLAGQTWLPQDHTGVDPAGDEPLPTRGLITQTDRTRLKSMLISGSAVIEDWVGDIATQPEVDAADVEGMLQRLGIMERSVRIFPGTLDELERISGLG